MRRAIVAVGAHDGHRVEPVGEVVRDDGDARPRNRPSRRPGTRARCRRRRGTSARPARPAEASPTLGSWWWCVSYSPSCAPCIATERSTKCSTRKPAANATITAGRPRNDRVAELEQLGQQVEGDQAEHHPGGEAEHQVQAVPRLAARRSRRARSRARVTRATRTARREPYTQNENRCQFRSGVRLPAVLAVTRLRAARRRRRPEALLLGVLDLLAALAGPGFCAAGSGGPSTSRTCSCSSPSGRGPAPTGGRCRLRREDRLRRPDGVRRQRAERLRGRGRARTAGRVAHCHPPTQSPRRQPAGWRPSWPRAARAAAATTPSSASASAGASSTPAARSTGAPAPPGTTARSASSSRRTSAASGGSTMVQSRDDVVGPRLRGHPGPRRVGGLRPRRHVHRPAVGVPVLPQAVPRRPPRGGVRGEARARRRPTAWPTSTAPTAA